MIDKIFIINLKHRTDRKKLVLNELEKQKIPSSQYEFFNGVRPTIEDVFKWNENFCHHVLNDVQPKKREKYLIGCLGCLKSHVEIAKLSLERGYNNVLVLEDDTEFINNYENISEYMKQIDNKYDMLYLSGSHLGTKKPVTDNIHKVEGTHTTGSYLIQKNAMEFLVNNIDGYEKEIDVFYANVLQKKLNCYCTSPHITKQRDGFSDIQQNLVNYKLSEN
jgi:glycosyl transferase, family 25